MTTDYDERLIARLEKEYNEFAPQYSAFYKAHNRATTQPEPDVPDEILECARKLEMWMNQNGHRHWQLLGVCDRSFAIRLEKIMDVLITWSK